MKIKVTHIGSIALGLLTHEQAASVIGVTSRGVFLHLASKWVIYLSNEAQRGPLTLNCIGKGELLISITHGERAEISQGKINFPANGMVIDTRQAIPWQASALPNALLTPDERLEKLKLVAGLVHDRQPASLLAGLLPVVTGITRPTSAPLHALTPQIEGMQSALAQYQLTAIVSSLTGFFGLGSGLTPSGDDLVLGFLLALQRWGHALASEPEFVELTRQLLPLAYQKTTTLSANLIECASLGQADERLLLALDGIMTANPDPPTCAAALAAWGNTSGHDALVGMALVLQAPH